MIWYCSACYRPKSYTFRLCGGIIIISINFIIIVLYYYFLKVLHYKNGSLKSHPQKRFWEKCGIPFSPRVSTCISGFLFVCSVISDIQSRTETDCSAEASYDLPARAPPLVPLCVQSESHCARRNLRCGHVHIVFTERLGGSASARRAANQRAHSSVWHLCNSSARQPGECGGEQVWVWVLYVSSNLETY